MLTLTYQWTVFLKIISFGNEPVYFYHAYFSVRNRLHYITLLSELASAVHYDTTSRTCLTCKPPKLFQRQCNLMRHMKIHYGGFKCSECSKTFDRKDRLQVHMLRHTKGIKPFSCTFCGKSFTRKEGLEKHKLAAHNLKPPEFVCSLCFVTFQKKSGIKEHLTKDHPDGNFKCMNSNCSAQFKKSTSFHDHFRNCGTSNPKFKCFFANCYKVFRTKGLLDQHSLKHKDPQLVCHNCGKTFRWLSSYNAHLRAENKRKKTMQSITDEPESELGKGASLCAAKQSLASPETQENVGRSQPFAAAQETHIWNSHTFQEKNLWPGSIPHVDVQASDTVPVQGQISTSVQLSVAGEDNLGQFVQGVNQTI